MAAARPSPGWGVKLTMIRLRLSPRRLVAQPRIQVKMLGMPIRSCLWVLALAATVGIADAQLSSTEMKAIQDALTVGDMGVKDLNLPRPLPTDSFLLPVVKLALSQPLDGANALLYLHSEALSKPAAALLGVADTDAFGDKPSTAGPSSEPSLPKKLPAPMAESVGRLIGGIEQANAAISNALSKLTVQERTDLVSTLPVIASDGQITTAFSPKRLSDSGPEIAALGRVDLAAIRAAGARLESIVEGEVPKLKQMQAEYAFQGDLTTTVDGLKVEISGGEDTEHAANDAALCISFGPRAHFTGRYGAGMANAGVLIDLSASSTYDVPDASVGCGILGIGIAHIAGGGHMLRSHALAFGAGLGGVGVLTVEGGLNDFDSSAMAQGFGAWGIGLLDAKGGENSFRGKYLCQGAGRTGGLGWLVEQAGRNHYRCGRLVKDGEDGFRTMGQGFGGGLGAGLSGGLGLLTAKGSEDVAIGDSLCQGAGAWSGVGSVYNDGSDATWEADAKAQGVGEESGAGYFFQEGSDNLMGLHEALGHGAGWRYGLGVVAVRGNHNVFAARDEKAGFGDDRGCGLFLLDGDGNRVFGEPGIAAGNSLGLCVSLGADNAVGGANATDVALSHSEWSAVYLAPGTPSTVIDPAPLPPLDSVPMPDDLTMQSVTGDLASNRGHLAGMGKKGLMWVLQHRLKNLKSDEVGDLAFLVKVNGDAGAQLLQPFLNDPDETVDANAFRVAIAANASGVAPNVVPGLKQPSVQALAAEAAGLFGVKEAVPDLMVLAGSSDANTAASAAIALAEIGDPQSLTTAQALVLSDVLPVRKASLQLLAKFPSQGMTTAQGLVTGSDMRGRAIGLELLGLIGTAEALDLAGGYLTDQNPGVRIQAARALDAKCPDKYRTALLLLRQDSDPLVRAAAMDVDALR